MSEIYADAKKTLTAENVYGIIYHVILVGYVHFNNQQKFFRPLSHCRNRQIRRDFPFVKTFGFAGKVCRCISVGIPVFRFCGIDKGTRFLVLYLKGDGAQQLA